MWNIIGTINTPLFDPIQPLTANPFPGAAGIGIGAGIVPNENFKVTNCTCELCGHFGIFIEHQKIYGGGSVEAKDAIIANNICRNNRFSGTGIRGGTRPTIIGNQSYGNGCFGLSIDSAGNVDPNNFKRWVNSR